ncbi:MAG: hypothetical protein HYZ94_02705 [Candidatus Omnitrophica bacterium]|nr:hypothetical protein [Candidatus Omnitrophota bacterium]
MRRALLLLLACTMSTGMAPEEKPKVVMNTVTGQVSAAGNSGIAVEVGSSKLGSSELYIPLDKKTKFQRFEKPAQLKTGDTVKVVYEQKYHEPEAGKKVYVGATAVEVTLLKQAPAEGSLISRREEAR